MENLGKILVLGVGLAILTGCGSDKLVCSLKDGSETDKNTITFKDDKATHISGYATVEANSEQDAEDYKTSMTSLIKMGTSNEEGFTFEITTKGKEVRISQEYDLAKISENYISTVFGEDLSYGGLKAKFEKDGYTCK